MKANKEIIFFSIFCYYAEIYENILTKQLGISFVLQALIVAKNWNTRKWKSKHPNVKYISVLLGKTVLTTGPAERIFKWSTSANANQRKREKIKGVGAGRDVLSRENFKLKSSEMAISPI